MQGKEPTESKGESDQRLEAQIEKGLLMQASRLLREPESPVTEGSILNLRIFAEAVVCCDTVHLPYRRGPSPMELVPEELSSGIFRYEEIPEREADDKLERAKKNSIALANSVIRNEPSVGLTQLRFVEKTMKEWGAGWYEALMRDCRSTLDARQGYERYALNRTLSHFSTLDYADLDDPQKIAVIHLWRCFYNIDLANENDRIWLHNEVRTPLVGAVLDFMDTDSLLGGILDTGVAVGMTREKARWNQVTYSLLYNILKKAGCDRKKISRAILELRNSPPAREFRDHFRRIRQATTAGGLTEALEDDAVRIMQLWAAIRALGDEPIKDLRSLSELKSTGLLQALLSARSIPYLYVACRHMRLLWQRQDGKFKRELEGLICRTFPEIRVQMLGRL